MAEFDALDTPVVRLTSTTAPNKIFHSREELAQHYKSDWHKYNCKRKEAGLPLLREEDFEARLQAALAVKRERENKQQKEGKDHLKKDKDRKSTKPESPEAEKKDSQEETKNEDLDEEGPPVIDPCQSLFDSSVQATVRDNVEYMQKKYGFFIPDAEYLTKLSNLIGYCQEKIQIGQLCLYCQKGFKSPRAVKAHMIDSRHTKLLYEEGVDLWEYEPFYDFSEANKEFWESWGGKKPSGNTIKIRSEELPNAQGMDEEGDDLDNSEWEDVTDSEKDEDEDDYEDYAAHISKHGFDVTPLGELIFPDGRVVGHRALSRYYKQRITPMQERAAVRAARVAAAERYLPPGTNPSEILRAAPSNKPTRGSAAVYKLGRDQTGILVPTGSGFTTLSLYRHKAVVKKARREEAKSRRMQQRTTLPINKMDKKGNRLITNVSVAHAPR